VCLGVVTVYSELMLLLDMGVETKIASYFTRTCLWQLADEWKWPHLANERSA